MGYFTGLTKAATSPSLESMNVELPATQEVRLHELAARTGRPIDELVREAVAKLLGDDEWFQEQVQVGMDQIARGEFIEEEEMDARVERMLGH
jgi:predicted transcriptional regulator